MLKCKSMLSLFPSVNAAPDINKELDPRASPIVIDPGLFHGSLHKGKDETDMNCWTSPSGSGFMIRGKNYLKDNSKVGVNFLSNYSYLYQGPFFSIYANKAI